MSGDMVWLMAGVVSAVVLWCVVSGWEYVWSWGGMDMVRELMADVISARWRRIYIEWMGWMYGFEGGCGAC